MIYFNQRFKKLRNKKGFTLVELIVVIVIIGILAAIMIPRMSGFTDKAKSTQALVNAKQVATAADSLYAEKNTEPSAADIAKLAGSDITASAITNIDVSDGHVTFTYKIGSYTAKRVSSGAITVD